MAGLGLFTGATAAIVLNPASTSVRAGSSTTISASRSGSPVTGTWTVIGGAAYGTVNASGVYTAPATVPSLISLAVVHFASGTQTADTVMTLLNPTPAISSTSVSALSAKVTPVTVVGSGFVPKSQVLVNGAAAPVTYIDSSHLAVTVTLPSSAASGVTLQVSNPAPGAITSAVSTVPVALPAVSKGSVSPSMLAAGKITVTFTYPSGIPSWPALTIDGGGMTTVSSTATTLTATGYLAPWKTGTTQITLYTSGAPVAQVAVPIAPTTTSFDVASRFASQAAFGPRMDVVQHIQQVGLSAFVDEQEAIAPDPYNLTEGPQAHFMRATLNANDLLRKRMGWALQVMIPEGANINPQALQPWETTLEADAFGSYRKILDDAIGNAEVAYLLTLPNNFATSNSDSHANQNFGRELMQLFSLGTTLLNDDGTPVLDGNGLPKATYTQNDVADASRALTGWTYPSPVNAVFTNFGIDWSLPLVANEGGHDHGSKTVLGARFAAGQTAAQDRAQLLDVIFNHQNMPPFVSRILIQRLVKSQPTAAYVKRIAGVFKNDGNGVRGNLGAVVKAILLDPEARAGDTTYDATAGFVQDPLYQQLAEMSLFTITQFDDQPAYNPSKFKLPWWSSPSVFSYYSPSYTAPGTTVNSPEFQLIDTVTIVQRSQFLWGVVTNTSAGIPYHSNELLTFFPDLTSMVDAMNHILMHGQMPQATHDAIMGYCSTISDPTLQLQSAIFLALNSDNYNVVQ